MSSNREDQITCTINSIYRIRFVVGVTQDDWIIINTSLSKSIRVGVAQDDWTINTLLERNPFALRSRFMPRYLSYLKLIVIRIVIKHRTFDPVAAVVQSCPVHR